MYRSAISLTILAAGVLAYAGGTGPGPEARITTLLQTLKEGSAPEREGAARELEAVVRKDGLGRLPARDVIPPLAAAAGDPSAAVRREAVRAVAAVNDPAAVPTFVKALDDPDGQVWITACHGLRALGPKAKAAVPALSARIEAGKLPSGTAILALAAIAGRDAVPVILRAAAADRVGPNGGFEVVRALADLADPRAAGYMAGVLESRSDYQPPYYAAVYFARLGDGPSVARLRACLEYLPRPGDDKYGPLSTKLSMTAEVRRFAVEALAKRKDPEAFGPIVRMLEADPSIRVRAAAAAALGEYADGRAVAPLVKALGQKDEGFESHGHRDGELRRLAVRSLGRIGTADALAALYEGMRGGPAADQCGSFWSAADGPEYLPAFLAFYDAKPIDPGLAAGVIQRQLEARGGEKKMTPDDQRRAEAGFRAGVSDPARFGPAVDLSEGGKYVVRTEFTFYPSGFALVCFDFRPQPRGFGHGYAVLYRASGAEWRPVSRRFSWSE